MTDRPLIVNATAIGRRVDGISVYGVHLVNALWRAGSRRPLTVVLNRDARRFFPDAERPEGAAVRWVSAGMSPSRGTAGNVRRWMFANHLARQRRDAIVFAISQLEAPVVGGRGVVMVHDMIPWRFRHSHPRQYYFYRYCLGRALRRARAVITPSHATKDDVCRHYGIAGDRVHVIPHGSPVPVSSPAALDAHRGRDILCIGRSAPTKNLAALLAGFRMLDPRLDAQLVIAGDGPPIDLGGAGVEAEALGRVTVLGAVTESEKLMLLDRAAVLVCPSLYEGFGLVPLEAMARGCPVVTTRLGSLPEVCADAAIYVDPNQPRQIAEALSRVLVRPESTRELVERGRARARAMTWEAAGRAHLALIDRVTRVDVDARSLSAGGHDEPIGVDALP